MAGVIVWGHVEYHGNGPCSCLKPEVVCCFCNVHVGEEGACYCALAQGENLGLPELLFVFFSQHYCSQEDK